MVIIMKKSLGKSKNKSFKKDLGLQPHDLEYLKDEVRNLWTVLGILFKITGLLLKRGKNKKQNRGKKWKKHPNPLKRSKKRM